MREIQFRAWDKRNNLMIRDIFTVSEYGTPSLPYPLVPPGLIWQQFTGLHDKRGKEIYEGDILQDSPTYKGICKYFNHKACFYIDRNEFGTGGKGYLEDSMEVIGNIYENSDWNWNGIEKLIKRTELAKTGYVSRKMNKVIKVIDEQLQELEACRDANVQKKNRITELEQEVHDYKLAAEIKNATLRTFRQRIWGAWKVLTGEAGIILVRIDPKEVINE